MVLRITNLQITWKTHTVKKKSACSSYEQNLMKNLLHRHSGATYTFPLPENKILQITTASSTVPHLSSVSPPALNSPGTSWRRKHSSCYHTSDTQTSLTDFVPEKESLLSSIEPKKVTFQMKQGFLDPCARPSIDSICRKCYSAIACSIHIWQMALCKHDYEFNMAISYIMQTVTQDNGI